MKYLLLIYHDETAFERLSETDRQGVYSEYRQLMEQTAATGHLLGGSELRPTTAATSVRVRNGRRLLTDGPFAETREQLGGYLLIDAKDLDEAVAIAERVPAARDGTIEIRPLVEGAPAAP